MDRSAGTALCRLVLVAGCITACVAMSFHDKDLHQRKLDHSKRSRELQMRLREIRDKKFRPIDTPAAPAKTIVEKAVVEKKGKGKGSGKGKPRPNGGASGRVSYRQCAVEPSVRMDCGFYGVTQEDCSRRECCWQTTEDQDVPWCYHSKPTMTAGCLSDVTERIECGSYGVRKEQCLHLGCCWQPSATANAPWCFQQYHAPVHDGDCGTPAIPPSVLGRIVGGDEATPNSWPWMVSLQIDDFHFCGGSLINDQWIVSAAHCEPAFAWGDQDNVVLGMHSQTELESTKISVEIEATYGHNLYGTSNGMDHDVMLIKLANPVTFSDAVSPVCLPGANEEIAPGRRCYTTGWGALEAGGGAPDVLQQVMVPIVDTAVCNEGDWYGGQIDDTMVCAGYEEGGRDSCQGDSGGPLVCYEGGSWKLFGIVSWGYGCASERKPGVYSKTSQFAGWISETISENAKRGLRTDLENRVHV